MFPSFNRSSALPVLQLVLSTILTAPRTNQLLPSLYSSARHFSSSIMSQTQWKQNLDEGDPNSSKYTPPYLKLYSKGTPNGQKITTYLSLLQKPYHYRQIDFSTKEQKQDWYIKMNPNGRIPTLSDVDANGKQTVIFETAAILLYLGENYDVKREFYYDMSSPYYWEQVKWLTFHVASHAPYQGQANHFFSADEDIPYAKKRFYDETMRILNVFEMRLNENSGWLVSDRLNIADIAAFCWVKYAPRIGIDLAKEVPAVSKWVNKINAIPAVQEGTSVK